MERLDLIVKGFIVAIGGLISHIVGGLGLLVTVLIIFMLADFATGIMASRYVGKAIKSDIGIKGLIKKAYILILVGCVYLIEMLGINYAGLDVTGFTGDALAFLFCITELVSIIENGSKMGQRFPKPIKEFIRKANNFLNGGCDDSDR